MVSRGRFRSALNAAGREAIVCLMATMAPAPPSRPAVTVNRRHIVVPSFQSRKVSLIDAKTRALLCSPDGLLWLLAESET